ncbi:hypothetical protein KIN20_019120 [Parelaphostrongylus tenuis]|uniref:Uncharacterized protein n=1 Tax=Parelaphostrongylus tenuis TaxID=148309 RepID=A0AAD5N522_PARTN|nr:hypothetical protein KIN20_019120 [Parelaphostrongylus tenuis]
MNEVNGHLLPLRFTVLGLSRHLMKWPATKSFLMDISSIQRLRPRYTCDRSYVEVFCGDCTDRTLSSWSSLKLEAYRTQRRISRASLSGKEYQDSSIQVTSLALLIAFLIYVAVGALLLPALNGQTLAFYSNKLALAPVLGFTISDRVKLSSDIFYHFYDLYSADTDEFPICCDTIHHLIYGLWKERMGGGECLRFQHGNRSMALMRCTCESSIYGQCIASHDVTDLAAVLLDDAIAQDSGAKIDFFNGLYFNFLCLTAIDFGQLVPTSLNDVEEFSSTLE